MSIDDIAHEYRAAKEAAAAFELTGWTALELSGRDVVKFLHNFCTADIKGLSAGEGCEAFLTNVKARVVGHALVFVAGHAEGTTIRLLATPGQAEKLISHLDRYVITEDVTIRDLSSEIRLLYVVGPQAMDRLAAKMVDPPPMPAAGRFTSGTMQTSAGTWMVRRADLFAMPGFLIETPREHVASVLVDLASVGLITGGDVAFESLRVDAGFPRYGIDVTEDHLAPEVGRPWAISYTKGCYLGQEPIARIDALGHVNRLLRRLKIDGQTVPEPSATIVADGKEIGGITSAARSVQDGRAVAMGYVRAKFAEPGTRVAVRIGDGEAGADVLGAIAPGQSV